MIGRSGEIRSTRAPKLREDQIEVLGRYGQTRKTEVGEVLFRAGDTSNDFIVILEGEVEVIDDFAGEARTIGVFLAGRFLGELNMLTGQAMYLSAVVREGGEVLAISREQLKEVVTEEPNLSDIILKAFIARRSWGMRAGFGLRINRLAPLERCVAPEGVRSSQPAAPRLDRARGGPHRRSLAREVRCEAIGDSFVCGKRLHIDPCATHANTRR
jgi:thioredoxin reductase (NADPH)